MTSLTPLTQDDVSQLLREPSPEMRAATAAKIAVEFMDDGLDPAARRVAEEIFRIMLRDAEVRVRRALSDSLKDCDLVPHDVALALANDVIEVADPILKFSQVLTDEDLIEIVQTRPTACRVAVAQRWRVPPVVSDAMVKSNDEEAVAVLVGNPGAMVTERTLEEILDIFPQSDAIKHNMTHRPSLPVRAAERLVTMVSDRLREHLVTHHELSPGIAADLVVQSREKAALGLLSPNAQRVDVEELVAQLHANGRLTSTIILRALCTGDILFFESALARLANIPVSSCHELIHDEGPLGLENLYAKARLPQKMYAAVRVAVNVARDMSYDDRPHDQERYRSRMIERVLTQFESLGADNLDYLFARLGRNFADESTDGS